MRFSRVHAARGDRRGERQPGRDEIRFAIGQGAVSIKPLSPLPAITDPLVVDGTTQPGYDGTPVVELNGSLAGAGAVGLRIEAGDSAIQGLAVTSFASHGIALLQLGGNRIRGNLIGITRSQTRAGNAIGVYIETGSNTIGGIEPADRNVISGQSKPAPNGFGILLSGAGATGNTIQGNLIGTDATGTDTVRNLIGVGLLSAPGNLIGGTEPGAGNVISGNGNQGLRLHGAHANMVQGNLIGTDVTGMRALGNRTEGVRVKGAASNGIGGAEPGAGNVISGNKIGIQINERSAGTVVRGNLIGTDAGGTAALGNLTDGVVVASSANNVIGGAEPGAGNTIGGNGGHGIVATSAVVIHGNLIGVGADDRPIGNGRAGVLIRATSAAVGGTEPGQGNTIAFNGEAGVAIASGSRNAVLSNRIRDNIGLGIDLGATGPALNDPGDADAGPNGLQNHPVLTAAAGAADGTTISGTIASTKSKTYRIEVFTSTACDPSGMGEGGALLAVVTVAANSAGEAAFSITAPEVAAGEMLTATATEGSSTSEFSACLDVTAA